MADPVFERYKEALKQGHVAVFKGRPKEALGHYQEAAKLAGHRPLPFASMGSVLLQMGRHQESIAAYEEALRRAPDDGQSLNGLASALTAAGRHADAADVLKRVALVEAEESRQRAEAAAAARAEGPERHMIAAEDARRANQPRTAIDSYVAAAIGFQSAGQLDASLDACQRALAVSQGAPTVHLQMARVYFQRGWTELATERMLLLDRMLSLEDDPLVRESLRELARTHHASEPRLSRLAIGSPT
jgi:tetratricopeptide (TPR) repeat protein